MEQSKGNIVRWRYIMFIILTAVGLCLACSKKPPQTRKNVDSSLVLETKQLDIGDINEGETKTGTISVINRGASPITIEEITASCGCTSAKVEPELIEPGANGALSVQLAGQGRRGTFGSKITLRVSEKNNNVQSTIAAFVKGNALFVANLSPGWLDFGEIATDHPSKLKSIDLTRGTQKVLFTKVSVETSSNAITADVNKITDNRWIISFQILPQKLPAGPMLASATIIFRDSENTELARNEVSIRGEIKGLVTANPKTLFFGVIRESESKEGCIRFHVPEGRKAKIKTIRIEPVNDCLHITQPKMDSTSQYLQLNYILSVLGKSGNLSGHIFIEFEDVEIGRISIPYILFVKPIVKGTSGNS